MVFVRVFLSGASDFLERELDGREVDGFGADCRVACRGWLEGLTWTSRRELCAFGELRGTDCPVAGRLGEAAGLTWTSRRAAPVLGVLAVRCCLLSGRVVG